MILAVTGGRHYSDRETVFRVLDEVHRVTPVTLLVQGYASGADTLAIEWAESRGVLHTGKKYIAHWYANGKLDRSAGPRRNKLMLEQEGVQRLIAFPGNKGTNGCVELAEGMGIPVRRVPDPNDIFTRVLAGTAPKHTG